MSNDSRIGQGTVIRGAVRGEGELIIDGRVEGVLDVDGDITLSETARVRIEQGALSGRRVTVRGAVSGDLRGSAAVVLEEGARVVGDLAAPSIGIRPGGLLRGHVSTSGEAPSDAPTRGRAERATPAKASTARATPAKVAPARSSATSARQAPKVAAPPPRAARSTPVRLPNLRSEEPVEAVTTPAPRRGREAPAPVVPALKRGQKGQMKKRAGR